MELFWGAIACKIAARFLLIVALLLSSLALSPSGDSSVYAQNGGVTFTITGPTSVQPNEEYTYNLKLVNNSGETLTETFLVDIVPIGAEVVSFSDGGTYMEENLLMFWDVGSVAPGQTVTSQFTVKAPDLPGTELFNLVSFGMWGPEGEGLAGGQNIITEIAGEAVADEADVNLVSTISHSQQGGQDIFDVVITNEGDAAVSETFYVDLYIDPPRQIVQAGYDWRSVGSKQSPLQGIEWEIDGIDAGETLRLTSASSGSGIQPLATNTVWNGLLPAGVGQVTAFVDSWAANGSFSGLVRESNEQDNFSTVEFDTSFPLPDPAAPTATPTSPPPVPTRVPTPTPTAMPTPGAENGSPFLSEIDFNVSRDGYAFENWGGTQYPDSGDMDTATMVRMFGAENVCQSGNNAASCVLSAAARQWRELQLKNMQIGRCYGFAVTSQQFYNETQNPSDWQGGAINAIDLTPSTGVRANITEFAIAQTLVPTDGSDHQWVWMGEGNKPSDILELIRRRFESNPNDPYVLGFFKSGVGGHATTPYAIEEKGNGLFWLYMYDNNWPEQTRYMVFDTVQETWRYDFSSLNPAEPAQIWDGDARTDSLVLRPTSAHLSSGWACPFCQRSTNVIGASIANTQVEFELFGQGEMLIVDAADQAVGFDFERRQFINQVANADLQPILGGLGVEQSPILRLPLQTANQPTLRDPLGGQDAGSDGQRRSAHVGSGLCGGVGVCAN